MSVNDQPKTQSSNNGNIKNNDNNSHNSLTPVDRRVGVADYFTILGVGETLVWKHAQKKSAESPSDNTSEEEDDAALLERFYREIVQVSIVTATPNTATTVVEDVDSSSSYHQTSTHVSNAKTNNTNANNNNSQQQLVTVPSYADESTTKSTTKPVQYYAVSIPTSPSDVTSTVTRTDIDTNSSMQQQQQQQRPELAGLTIVQNTCPAAWGDRPPTAQTSQNPNTPTSPSSHHHQQQQHQGPGSSTPPLWSKSQVFEANLDPISGLTGELKSMYLQTADSDSAYTTSTNSHHLPKHHSFPQQRENMNSVTAPLSQLRRKVQSTLRLGKPFDSDKKSSHSGPKFYLAFRRRAPDESLRPAVSNLELLYVKLHKATLVDGQYNPHGDQHNQQQQAVPPPPASISGASYTSAAVMGAAALVGRVAEAGKQAVRDRVAGHIAGSSVNNTSMSDNGATDGTASSVTGTTSTSFVDLGQLQLVPLVDLLPQPESIGCDEWSIPERYKHLRMPSPSTLCPSETSANEPDHGTLLLLSQGKDEATLNAASSGAGVEAMVGSSKSAAASDHPRQKTVEDNETAGDDKKQGHNENGSDGTPQIDEIWKPKLISDVNDIIVDGDEEQFAYIPILAIRRQRVGDEERYHEDAGIVEITTSFFDRNGSAVLPAEMIDDFDTEEEDEGTFSLLGKSPWIAAATIASRRRRQQQQLISRENRNRDSRPLGGPLLQGLGDTAILVKRNLPLGFCDAAFATRVLDRFPLRNYKGLPLPEEELPMFCYPTGCRLHRAQFSDAPLAQYYGFVVKNERGDSIYVSCVSFMEPLTKNKVEQLALMSEKRRRVSLPHRYFADRRRRQRRQQRHHNATSAEGHPGHYEDDVSSSHTSDLRMDEGVETNQLSDDLLDENDSNFLLTGFDEMTTFENKTICLVSRYPFWTAFRRFLSHLHVLSGSSSDLPLERCISHLLLSVPIPKPGGPNILIPLSSLNVPMVLSNPPLKDLPLVDLPFERLVACLDVPTIVAVVLGFLALERKVIVMSTRPSLVLDVCELLRSLLFPFELCAPYVPRLTEPFMSCLDFPGAIFVGIHDDGSSNGLAAVVRKNMPEDSTIVDLDSGSVDCSGERIAFLNSSWGIIPPGPRSVLVSEVETLCRDAGIVPGQEPLDSQIDSAFDASLPPVLVEDDGACGAAREPLDDRAIRDAFLRFFCSVLGGYERYLVVPDVDFLISGNEWFDSKGFLSSASEEKSPFLGALVSTQLFQSFIQRRTEASDVHCLLFDECLAEFHSAPIPYGRLGGDVETITSPDTDQPQMLYSLLVDQSATEPQQPGSGIGERSFDADSKHGSDTDNSSTYHISKASLSSTIDTNVDRLVAKNSDIVVNGSGDWVMLPSRQEIREGTRFAYCIDGNPSFPGRLNRHLYLPREPESWLVEMSEAPSPLLARSENEVEEAERRRRQATTYRGLQSQRRCHWQLPKLMGSHFLGSWLLCIPALVAQPHLPHDQQSKYLLRALGALRILRSKQRIVPDEAAYRALMVACGRTRNDRRMELVRLFGLLRSDGIFPSAMTLGQYTRALAEGYSKRSMGTPDEEMGGVEVTESASRDLRVGVGRKETMDAEVALSALDGNLFNLEEAGRRWRHKNSSDKETSGKTQQKADDPSQSYDSKSSVRKEKPKKQNKHKPWLPVVFSSSFVPAKVADSGPNESRPLRSASVRLLAIWSRTKSCDSCGYIPLEEEVQAGWDVLGGDNDIPGAISCPRCGALLIPMLGYKEMSVEEALATEPARGFALTGTTRVADFAGLPPQIGPVLDAADASYVTYVSPASLRLSLERHIAEHGEEVLDREHLRAIDPELFYNFWWYCARFSLPLPLPVTVTGDETPEHYCTFAAWDQLVAERGCHSCAKSLMPFVVNDNVVESNSSDDTEQSEPVESFEDFPLMSRFNLQGFYSTVWDHEDLSEILVTLVEACDKRDFKPVIECIVCCNKRRRDTFGTPYAGSANSDANSSFSLPSIRPNGESSGSGDNQVTLQPSIELDCYRTVLYLAKYQCTTAFHAFFPATLKPCKGYHFWCPITPLPIFDRLLREAVKRVRTKDSSFIPIYDVSDVALGFRCVFDSSKGFASFVSMSLRRRSIPNLLIFGNISWRSKVPRSNAPFWLLDSAYYRSGVMLSFII